MNTAEPELITIVEGPPPEFKSTPDLWPLSIYEEPELHPLALCQMRTFSGPKMVERCRRKAIPVTFNQYISQSGAKGSDVPEQVKRVRADGRFSGFILYETYDFIRFGAQGRCSNIWPVLETLGPLLGP